MDVAHAVGERLDQDAIHQAQDRRERFLATAGFEILGADLLFGGVGRRTQINTREEGGFRIVGAGLHLGAVGGRGWGFSCLGIAPGWMGIGSVPELDGKGFEGYGLGTEPEPRLRSAMQSTTLRHFAVNEPGDAVLCCAVPTPSPRCRGAGFRRLWGGAPAQQHDQIETHVLQA